MIKKIPIKITLACLVAFALAVGGFAAAFSDFRPWGCLIVVAIIVLVGLLVCYELSFRIRQLKHEILQPLKNLQTTVGKQVTIDTMVELNAALAIRERFPGLLIPTSSYSMCFANLLAIVNLLDTHQPKLIVEFGSGISTLIVSAWIAERGFGKLVSFDHDLEWSDVTRHHVRRSGFQEFAEIRLSPLRNRTTLGKTFPWYDVTQDDLASFEDNLIDFMIVDGPPESLTHSDMGRFPAVEVLKRLLSNDSVIVLDDSKRENEQKVILHWQKILPDHGAVSFPTITGICVLRNSNTIRDVLASVH